jgi:hypothetical protein
MLVPAGAHFVRRHPSPEAADFEGGVDSAAEAAVRSTCPAARQTLV